MALPKNAEPCGESDELAVDVDEIVDRITQVQIWRSQPPEESERTARVEEWRSNVASEDTEASGDEISIIDEEEQVSILPNEAAHVLLEPPLDIPRLRSTAEQRRWDVLDKRSRLVGRRWAKDRADQKT